MPTFRDYFLLAFIFAAFNAPMAMISEFFTLLLFISAPLIARATSDRAPFAVIIALEDFVCLVVILVLIVLVRVVDAYLNLRSWPVKFFELLGSL